MPGEPLAPGNGPQPDSPRLDGPYWEGCYERGETRWEKGAPAPGLVDFLAAHPELPRGRVLVPGCGTGHDIRVFAREGFSVTGLDIAPSAVRLATLATDQAGLSARFLLADFLREEAPERFDWIWEHTLFCAISPDDREAYVRAVVRWLKPGGTYLAVNYLLPDPGGPPFTTTREELMRRFEPEFELLDAWVPRSFPNRAGLELMLWWKHRG